MNMTPGPWIVGPDPDDRDDCKSVWTDKPHALNAELAGRIGVPANALAISAVPLLVGKMQSIERIAMSAGGHGVMMQRILAEARIALKAAGCDV